MGVVRIEALRAFAAMIETAIPDLAGKVKAGQVPSGVDQTYPSLTIVPGPLSYEPAQDLEHATIGDPAAGNVVFNVGAHSGPFQLRLVATTIGERWTLEQKIVNLFMAQELRPGVIVVPVTSCPELGNWLAAFEYTSDQWIDTEAFDRKLESLITVNGIIPALIARTGVYEIDDLVIGLTDDFDTTFTTDTMVPPGVELVLINQDGTLSAYP